jgi:hypothetical protein
MTALLTAAATSAVITAASSASDCQSDGSGCAEAGTYTGPDAVISSDYLGFQVSWTRSVVDPYSSGEPLTWTAYMTYTDTGTSALTLACPGDWAHASDVSEHMSGGSGDSGVFSAGSTTCSKDPGLSVAVPAGGTYTSFATFATVPSPGTAVFITWGAAGTSASAYPFQSGPLAPPGSSSACDPAPLLFLGLHGLGQGPSGTVKPVSPEITDFDDAQNLLSGVIKAAPVSYPTAGFSLLDKRGKFNAGPLTKDLQIGVAHLQSALAADTKGCKPAQDDVALMGYSMGAWVIDDWLRTHKSEWPIVKAVVLFGDPCYYYGLAREWTRTCGPSPDYPYPAPASSLPFKVKAFCLKLDPVCGAGYALPGRKLQLAAAAACLKKKCAQLQYVDGAPSSGPLYSGAQFMVQTLDPPAAAATATATKARAAYAAMDRE